ncbi:hypothetical protein FF1_038736 [Malus domestica]
MLSAAVIYLKIKKWKSIKVGLLELEPDVEDPISSLFKNLMDYAQGKQVFDESPERECNGDFEYSKLGDDASRICASNDVVAASTSSTPSSPLLPNLRDHHYEQAQENDAESDRGAAVGGMACMMSAWAQQELMSDGSGGASSSAPPPWPPPLNEIDKTKVYQYTPKDLLRLLPRSCQRLQRPSSND